MWAVHLSSFLACFPSPYISSHSPFYFPSVFPSPLCCIPPHAFCPSLTLVFLLPLITCTVHLYDLSWASLPPLRSPSSVLAPPSFPPAIQTFGAFFPCLLSSHIPCARDNWRRSLYSIPRTCLPPWLSCTSNLPELSRHFSFSFWLSEPFYTCLGE